MPPNDPHATARRKMLDRLVRGAIFAKADGIVRHHMDDANAH